MKTGGYLNLKILQKMTSRNEFQSYADFGERLRALSEDGYKQRHITQVGELVIARLHHMANGNDIVLKVTRRYLEQKTNHVIVHRQEYA